MGGYVQETGQRTCDHKWGSVYVQPMIMGREGVCFFQVFSYYPGSSGLAVGMFQLSSMPQENAIRNNHWRSIVEQEGH